MGRGKVKDWDRTWMEYAKKIAESSIHPEFKVGAVVIDKEGFRLSTGYNRKPKGSEALGVKNTHAEIIAIVAQDRNDLKLYAIYITHPPCSTCCAAIVEAGIKRVVHAAGSEEYMEKWGDDCFTGRIILKNAGVEIVEAFEI